MVADKKIFTVDNLTAKIKDAAAFFLVSYQGLNVAQMTELRSSIKKAGGELEVVKNRLLKLALVNQKRALEDENTLTGPTAVLWAQEDEIAPLKALVSFAETNGSPQIKIGFLGQEYLSLERAQSLAKIPGRQALEGRLTGLLAGTFYRFINALGGNRVKLVYALKAISDKKTAN